MFPVPGKTWPENEPQMEYSLSRPRRTGSSPGPCLARGAPPWGLSVHVCAQHGPAEPLTTSPAYCFGTSPPPTLGSTTSRHSSPSSLASASFILESLINFSLSGVTGCISWVGEGWEGGKGLPEREHAARFSFWHWVFSPSQSHQKLLFTSVDLTEKKE